MVQGLDPAEANERLSIFQARFDELWRRHETCSGGERLFGLTIHEYPELMQRKRELNLLQKLYGLYSTVNTTIDSYYDLLWSEVDIEKINNDLVDFQNRFDFIQSTTFYKYACYFIIFGYLGAESSQRD